MKQYSLIIKEQSALDQRWFDALVALDAGTGIIGMSREVYTVLGLPHDKLEEYREAFEKRPFNPDLRPLHANPDDLLLPIAAMRRLKRKILALEENQAIRLAYSGKIDETLLHTEIFMAAAKHDNAGFAEANRKLYGKPDKRIFAAECDWLRHYAAEYADSSNRHVRSAADALLGVLPKVRGNQQHITPRNNVFRQVRQLHLASGGYFSQLFGDEPLPEYVNAEAGDPIARKAINAIGADYTLGDSTDELWGVVHGARQVVRPPGYNLPVAEFKGIVAHEVGSHLLERMNGRRQPLRLLELGLDRYERGNEGRAFLREQITYQSPYEMLHQPGWEYIVMKHLAISLGVGLDGKPYTFCELYDVMYRVCHFYQILRQPDNPVYAESTAHTETWHLLVRVLKGTDGMGGAYLKDIVYLEGNVRAWKMAAIDPAYILFGDHGKFDIARADHRRLLAKLDIRPHTSWRFPLALPPLSFRRPLPLPRKLRG